MSFNRPPPAPPKAKPKEGLLGKKAIPEDTNALWRLDQWFGALPAPVMAKLKAYHAELLKFNVKLNLISRSTEREADEIHFADCLLASEILLKQDLGKKVYDIGSGNGFPGLILATLDPTREYFLVESDTRKCEFLKHAVHRLELKNVMVMNVSLKSLKDSEVEVAVSRGFASIGKTLLSCNKIFKTGGRFFHLKASTWSTEIAELPSQLISVWSPALVGEYSLPVNQARRAIVGTQKNQ